MKVSNLQYLARRRNWLKYRLLGTYIQASTEYITLEESININAVNNLREQLVVNFDKNSKELGLKIPKYRCWCGKEGKYIPEYNCDVEKVCKKHIKDE